MVAYLKYSKLLLPLLFILLLIIWILKPPFFFETDLVDSIINVKRSDVRMIVIGPLKHINVKKNLIDEITRIEDIEFINNVCKYLNSATKHSASNSPRKWYCRVTLQKDSNEYVFTVRSTKTDGTLIYIDSRGEWGWPLGIYRSDKLGNAFENYFILRKK